MKIHQLFRVFSHDAGFTRVESYFVSIWAIPSSWKSFPPLLPKDFTHTYICGWCFILRRVRRWTNMRHVNVDLLSVIPWLRVLCNVVTRIFWNATQVHPVEALFWGASRGWCFITMIGLLPVAPRGRITYLWYVLISKRVSCNRKHRLNHHHRHYTKSFVLAAKRCTFWEEKIILAWKCLISRASNLSQARLCDEINSLQKVTNDLM